VNLILHPLALREAQEIVEWYETRLPGLGEGFVAALGESLHAIEERPYAWSTWPTEPTIRLKHLRRFPYVVPYRVEQSIRVLAVAHHKQKPGYWRGR
jgi:plasmid stabilization system protein ParE